MEGVPAGRFALDLHRHGLGDPEMMLPAAIPVAIPIVVGIIRPRCWAASIGTIVTGIFLAIAMTSGGGAWDNAKKRSRTVSTAARAGGPRRGGHGRHGRRSVQGHGRAAINPMIKIANIVAILIIPVIVSIHG